MMKFEYVKRIGRVHSFDLPTRGTIQSCGYDFHSPSSFELLPGVTTRVPLGVKVYLNEGTFLMIVPRSSVGMKYHVSLDNTIGIIDADYVDNTANEGEICLQITNHGDSTYVVKKNDRLCQGIILKYEVVDDDMAKNKRNGGMGSTGV